MGGGGDTEVKETSQEKELARIATEEWARYEETFKPLEDEWLSGITADSTNDKAKVGGVVAGEVANQYDYAQTASDDNALASGENVNSGGFKKGLSRAEDTGIALTRANLGVDASKTSKLMNAINVGRGQASEAQSTLTDVAGDAASDTINDTTRKWQSSNDTGTAVGTATGMLTRNFSGDEEDS